MVSNSFEIIDGEVFPILSKSDLEEIAIQLPIHPPLKPGGETTVKEMYPDLNEEELDYVMSKYTGNMQRG